MNPEIEQLFDDANGDLAVGELEAAAEKYQRCTELDPVFFDGWHALAMSRMKLGQYEAAIAAAEVITRLRPNEQLAWSTLSLCYVRADRIKDAESAGVKAKILGWGGKIVKDPPTDSQSAQGTAE